MVSLAVMGQLYKGLKGGGLRFKFGNGKRYGLYGSSILLGLGSASRVSPLSYQTERSQRRIPDIYTLISTLSTRGG